MLGLYFGLIAKMIFKNCPLCNKELTKHFIHKNELYELECHNQFCDIIFPVNSRFNLHSNFGCEIDIIEGIDKLISYSFNIKINNKIYNIFSGDQHTSLYEWRFESSIIEDADYWLDDDPTISINRFMEPDNTKEFYINLAKKLLNLTPFL